MDTSSIKLLPCQSETGTQLLNRLMKRNPLEDLDVLIFPSGLREGEIVDINGSSGCGKTNFLIHLIVRCITPKTWKCCNLDGLDIGISYIDTDHHFPMLRLISLLENRLKMSREEVFTAEEMHEFVSFCLKKLSIASCFDSLQFYSTLEVLSSSSSRWDCKILMIDSLSAFYWEDEMTKIRSKFECKNFYKNLASAIKKLSDNCRYTVFFTKLKIKKKFSVESGNDEVGTDDDSYNYLGQEIERLSNWKISISSKSRINNLPTLMKVVHNAENSYHVKFEVLERDYQLTLP
ncbi:DNA repair protein xrcc2 [Chamberlinius hualienensis]